VRFELLKILVVEDHRHMTTMLSEILRAVGVRQIVTAEDGASGFQALRSHAVDVVMTDLAMQPVDGVAFTRMIRSSQESPNQMIPVIMVTGQLTLARINEAREAGVNEFIAKPITGRAVIERLFQTIQHPRPFIRTDSFFGPDRRRRQDPNYHGPWRRAADGPRPLSQAGP
jgi:CheY-like chemotaxis protein